MGEYILVEPGRVVPSQDFLKEKTMAHILQCYKNHQENELPPPPMVRFDPNTHHYVAIDGHNLLAIDDLLKHKTKVFVAKNADDGLKGSSLGIEQRNKDLKEKFDQSLIEAESLKTKNIKTIRDLRLKYPSLINESAAHKHYNL